MTIYKGSAFPVGYEVGTRTPFPDLEVNDTSFENKKIVISGSVRLGKKTYTADYYYIGTFEYPLFGSVTGPLKTFSIYLDDRKAVAIKHLNVDMSDVLEMGDWEFERYTLRGDDKIIGSAFSDRFNGLKGDDIIAGGRGRNQISGGPGRDTFVIDKRGVQLIADFNVKQDRLNLPGLVPSLDAYNIFARNGKTILALEQNILAEFAGAPDLAKATII